MNPATSTNFIVVFLLNRWSSKSEFSANNQLVVASLKISVLDNKITRFTKLQPEKLTYIINIQLLETK